MTTPDRSKRSLILEALVTRLEAIARRPYETRAGRTIFVGEVPDLGPDDSDEAIVLSLGEEELGTQIRKLVVTWPIEIQARVKASSERAWVTREQLVADIQRAIELDDDQTLGGLLVKPGIQGGAVRTFDREPGSTTIAAGVRYTFEFWRSWGHPEG